MSNKNSLPRFDKSLLPGLALCLLLALPCWFLGKIFPVIGGPVFAILLGMLVALFYKQRQTTQAGIAFSSKKILQYAVILLGRLKFFAHHYQHHLHIADSGLCYLQTGQNAGQHGGFNRRRLLYLRRLRHCRHCAGHQSQ